MDDLKTHSHRKIVQDVFNQVVPYYDTMNDCLSLGLHRLWKKSCIDSIQLNNPQKIMDLSTGTGDLLLSLIKKYPGANFTAVDPDPQMLRYAQLKVAQQLQCSRVAYVQSCAEDLSMHTLEGFDLITCSFGLRNMSDIIKALSQMKKALNPKGQLRILEFAPSPERFQFFYQCYRKNYLSFVGRIFFNDPQSYQYLSDSIENFQTPLQIQLFLKDAGFTHVTATPYSQGIVYLYEATL